MYNLIEYGDNYLQTYGSLRQYFKDIPAVNDNGNIVEFNGANATYPFNFKVKITGQTGQTLTDSTNFFSPNNFKKNDDVILNYFMTNF